MFLRRPILAVLSGAFLCILGEGTPIVDLGYAQYQGAVDTSTNLTTFVGIRYAAAPIGVCPINFARNGLLKESYIRGLAFQSTPAPAERDWSPPGHHPAESVLPGKPRNESDKSIGSARGGSSWYIGGLSVPQVRNKAQIKRLLCDLISLRH
jgi:hypothetical protein